MKLKSILSVLALSTTVSLFSQELINGRGCATPVPPQQWDEAFNKQVEEFKQLRAAGKVASASYTIPVIVHVIYGTQAVGSYPNLSQAQINSQISVMNDDFAGAGYGVSGLPSVWSNLVANTGLSFCMAQLDPSGSPLAEPGIDRVSYTSLSTPSNPAAFSSQTAFQNFIDGTVKPETIWDPQRYFNIWVTDVKNSVGLLGYSTFPPLPNGLTGITGSYGTASTDGIWVYARSFGNIGSVSYPYDKGRTATHEAGHYFGLRHIWGDSNCGNDFCNDTPTQKQANQNCPTFPSITNCAISTNTANNGPNGDMFYDFMDYSFDACLALFTLDQNTRIQTAMTHSPYRTQLSASSATMCGLSSQIPTSSFSLSANQTCVDSSVAITNSSAGLPAPTYVWSSSDNSNVSFSPNNTSAAPTLSFASAGTYTITLTANNSAGTNLFSQLITVDNCGADVGIAKISALSKNISLVPNPSSGIVNIKATLSDNTNMEIALYNALGQLLLTKNYNHTSNNTYSLDLNAYSNGVYNVVISVGENKVNKRLILNK